ncbi:DUF899 family protein [Phytomonospora endophytica]|uniref:DUF899 family protein n=1 Tax=Phytomonospora endophytica TaxID=714109 RepID=UPI001941C55B
MTIGGVRRRSRDREALLSREKAHTREGDAIAAARRRLPVTEVDAGIPFTGAPRPASRAGVSPPTPSPSSCGGTNGCS